MRVLSRLGLQNPLEKGVWLLLAILLLPLSLILRFYFLSNALIEPHPWRQSQTALTIQQFYKHGIQWLDYRSPLAGELWRFVYEFPIYQALVALLMKTGVGIEVSSRLVTLFFFFAGIPFFAWVTNHFFGRRVTTWALLLYLVIPFNVIFSRVCLVDFTALAFLLAAWATHLKAFGMEGRTAVGFFALSLVLGTLAGLAKITIWYIPAAVLFLHTFWLGRKKVIPASTAVGGLGILLIQGVIAIAWILWGGQVRGDGGRATFHSMWFFGAFSDRFNLWEWKIIASYVRKLILQDWLLLPLGTTLVVGVWNRQKTVLMSILALLVPVLIMFHIYRKHDYYLIGQMPIYIALAAVGMVRIFTLSRGWRVTLLTVMGIVLCYRLSKLTWTYQPLFFDYHANLEEPRRLKQLTSAEDLIYLHGREGELQIPLYSDRLVATWERDSLQGLNPSVVWFEEGRERVEFLDPFDSVWIEGNKNYYVYRTRSVGEHAFNPGHHIGVFSHRKTSSVLPFDNPPVSLMRINTCKQSISGQIAIAFNEGEKGKIAVRSVENDHWLLLPLKSILILPSQSTWGCEFELQKIEVTS